MVDIMGISVGTGSTATLFTVLAVVGVCVLFMCLFLGGFYLVYMRKTFNKKVVLFQRVGNQIVPTFKDSAKRERVGNAGDFWFVCKKLKKTLPMPNIQMGKNTYWFFERKDNEWINFSLQDFDEIMKKAGIYFIHEDMRLQRLGIQKNLRDRFQKVTWWQKYGGIAVSVVFILVVTVCLVVLFQQMQGVWASAGQMASSVNNMAEAVRNQAVRYGSGVVPA